MSLRDKVDKIKPHFMPGGRFARLRSVFQGFDSFLFVPDRVTFKGSHIRDSIDLKRVMIIVVLALVPALLFGMYNTGLQHFRSIGWIHCSGRPFGSGSLKYCP
jgi:Na+-transporting NADH:ubiquinone oxidoreductase subunit B